MKIIAGSALLMNLDLILKLRLTGYLKSLQVLPRVNLRKQQNDFFSMQ